MRSRFLVLTLTATAWSAAAATTVFWLLQMVGPSAVVDRPGGAVMLVSGPTAAQASAAELLMLLGGTGANAESVPFEAKRYKLVGVVTGVRGGAALLSINDQPAKPYAVGSRIDDANLLLAVGLRHVVLGGDVQRGSRQMLELNVE